MVMASRGRLARTARSKRMRCGFPAAKADAEGVSPKVLGKIRKATRMEVRELGSCAGVTHLILRNGRCVFSCSDGFANVKSCTKFSPRTICRLHGATKALVCAAFLTLLERNEVKLDDPVSKYIAFSDRVAVGSGAATRPAKVRASLRHLLTMTAGLRYTDCPAYRGVIRGVRQGKIQSLAAFCDALAKAPLQSEPGEVYEYSFCTDVIGRVCEVVSGQSLEQFVRERLLDPLDMKDTHFNLPARKRSRVAALYKCEQSSAAKRRKGQLYTPVLWDHPDSAPSISSSGGGILSYKDPGMWGTAQDYARFCQMLLSGGRAPGTGRQVLKPSTVQACWRDGLAPLADRHGRVTNWNVDDTQGPPWEGGSWDRCGWSPLSTLLQLQGPLRKGPGRKAHTMGVGGGGGVYWLVDARRQLVALSFQQSFEGARPEDDGRGPPGNDCVDLAVEAVDAGSA
eukprot:TRINITY_DN30331_c0_g1_i1.p1 TRINITY_DN30331_c0_g1~~TRINITY_DN30331_c0_g1_i1.p1  ORF type:complete len:454 (-),score=69.74 TRINITY_DN30331_c0_g1_i1:65-1426(-)